MTDLSHTHSSQLQLHPADPTVEAMDSAAEAIRVLGEEDMAREELKKAAEKAAHEFGSNFQFHAVETMIHRFPAGLRGLGDRYIVPMAVAIGPYHRGLPQLAEMEKVKDAAAHHFIKGTGSTFEGIFETFFNVAVQARFFYADGVVAHMSDTKFACMMFCDACFLLQYMLSIADSHRLGEHLMIDSLLRDLFVSNRACIENDIMLLENQLPWTVVQALVQFCPGDNKVEKFIVKMGEKFHIPNNKNSKSKSAFVWDHREYSPPHLLGLLRFYKTTAPKRVDGVAQTSVPEGPPADEHMKMSVPIGASQLAINGIELTASESPEFNDVKITKGFCFDKFSLAPLSLDRTTACWLVNMAAFEVWTAAGFSEGSDRTAVSSYLALLAMLTDREEDVHKLRTNRYRLLRTELTDKQTLEFFDNIVENLSPGRCYFKILADIDKCKRGRFFRIMVCKFVYRNSKAIVTVLSIIGVLVGIFKTLLSLSQHRQ